VFGTMKQTGNVILSEMEQGRMKSNGSHYLFHQNIQSQTKHQFLSFLLY